MTRNTLNYISKISLKIQKGRRERLLLRKYLMKRMERKLIIKITKALNLHHKTTTVTTEIQKFPLFSDSQLGNQLKIADKHLTYKLKNLELMENTFLMDR